MRDMQSRYNTIHIDSPQLGSSVVEHLVYIQEAWVQSPVWPKYLRLPQWLWVLGSLPRETWVRFPSPHQPVVANFQYIGWEVLRSTFRFSADTLSMMSPSQTNTAQVCRLANQTNQGQAITRSM